MRALRQGHIAGTSTVVVRARDGARLRLTCELTALPHPRGGALGRLRSAAAPAPNLIFELAGAATLAARVSAGPLGEGLEQALDFVLRATAADAAEVFLAEPQGGGMVLTCHRGHFRQAFAEIFRFNPGEGFPGLVLSQRQPVYTDALAEDARFLRLRVKQEGFRSYVGVPLTSLSGVVGSMGVAFKHPGVDLDRALRLLSWAATPTGLLVDAAVAHLRDAVTVQLHAIGHDPEEHLRAVLRAALTEMVRLGGAPSGGLYAWWRDQTVRWVTQGSPPVPQCAALREGAASHCPAVRTGTGRVLYGARETWPPPCRRTARPGGAWYCIPVRDGAGVLGVASLPCRMPRRSLPSENLALLESAAAAAGAGIRGAWESLERARRADAVLRGGLQQATAAPEAAGWSAVQRVRVGTLAANDCRDAAPLEIRCFGPFELCVQGTPIPPATVHRRKTLTLLKILLVHHGRPQPKDVLMELLWPDADPETKTGQFYVLVHELRRLVEPGDRNGSWRFICNEGDRYYLNARAPARVDAREFKVLIDLGRTAEARGDGEAAVAAYESAVELYRGDFMEDEPFADWSWQERERFREACLGALRSLAALRARAGHWDQSAGYLRHALRLDQLREDVHRELMYALWASGHRDEAVRQYELCARLLREELDLPPLPETERLLDQIRAAPCPPEALRASP